MHDDHFEIGALVAAYCQRCDDGQFDELADLFAPDATFETVKETVQGPAAIAAWFAVAQAAERRGKHITTNHLVHVSDGRAHAETDFLFVAYRGDALVPLAAGRYSDEFAKEQGVWKFARRRITPLALGTAP